MAEYTETTKEIDADEFESYEEFEDKKESKKQDKRAEADLLKAQNQARQLDLDEKKLAFEQEEAKAKRELESKKLDLELKKLDNDRELEEKKIKVEEKKAQTDADRAENEKKDAKKDRIVKIAVGGLGLVGTGLGIYMSRKCFLESMYFEETGSFHSSTSKAGQAMIQSTAKKLENVASKMQ